MPAHSETIRLLKGAFKKEEWDFLSGHRAFKYQLIKGDGSVESYENLVDIGSLLLRERGDWNMIKRLRL